MDDQARKVFISIVAVLLFLFPGIGLICFGLVSLVDSVLGFRFFASDLSTYLWYIFGGGCGGFLLILLSIIVIFIAFRKKKIVTTSPPNYVPPGVADTHPTTLITPRPSVMDETEHPGMGRPTASAMDEPITPYIEEPTTPDEDETTPEAPDEPIPPPS